MALDKTLLAGGKLCTLLCSSFWTDGTMSRLSDY